VNFGARDFTIEMLLVRPRCVYRWRGKKFVVKSPWRHVASVCADGGTTHYVDGVEVQP